VTLARFLVHPVHLVDPAMATNRYGDEVPDWDAPPVATHDEMGWFAATGSDEDAAGREAITGHAELSVGPDSALTETMRVEYDGGVYEIRGGIRRAVTPEGTHHKVALLRRVQG
jgi:hypothetical protein